MIYQNINPDNQVQIWIQPDFSVPPQVTFDNRSTELIVTVVLNPVITTMPDPDLGNRFIHTLPSSDRIRRVLVLDNQDRQLFQSVDGREYNIIFFRAHD